VQRSEFDRTTNLVGAFAMLATDAVREATERAAGHRDSAPAALVALYESARGRSVDELRQVVGLTPSGGVRLVDRLVAAGHAERRTGSDRRTVLVMLTPRGRRAAKAVQGARMQAVDGVLAGLTAAERLSLGKLVAKLIGTSTLERLSQRRRGEVPAGGWLCRLCDFSACGRDRDECPAATAAASSPQASTATVGPYRSTRAAWR